jgi:hypothetical protein
MVPILAFTIATSVLFPQTSNGWEQLPPVTLGEPARPAAEQGKPPVHPPETLEPRPRFNFTTLATGNPRLARLLGLVMRDNPDLDRGWRLWQAAPADALDTGDDPLRLFVEGLRAARNSSQLNDYRLEALAAAYLGPKTIQDNLSRRDRLFVLQNLWLRAALDLTCLADARAIAESSRNGLQGGRPEALINAYLMAFDREASYAHALQDPVRCRRKADSYASLWEAIEMQSRQLTDARPPEPDRQPDRQPDRPPSGISQVKPPSQASQSEVAQSDTPDKPAAVVPPTVGSGVPLANNSRPADCDLAPAALHARLQSLGTQVHALDQRKDDLHQFYWNWYRRIPDECDALLNAWPGQQRALKQLLVGELEQSLKDAYACLNYGHARMLSMASNPAIGPQLSRLLQQAKQVDEYFTTIYRIANKRLRLQQGIENQLITPCRESSL